MKASRRVQYVKDPVNAFAALTTIMRIIMIVAFVIGSAIAQENYATWSDSQRIYINTTSSGANVAGTLTNFPVLIRLNPSNFTRFSRTQPLGADIRFATSTGVHLDYQIERWVDGPGDADTAVIWVKVPSIAGNNSTQFIWMYYGKTGVADSSKGWMVFDNGFTSVWHMNDPTGTGPRDATASANHFSTRPGVTQVMGVIGLARRYGSAIGAYDTIASKSSLNIDANRAMTISAWVNRTGNGPTNAPDQGIFCKYRWAAGRQNLREYALLYWSPHYSSTVGDTGFMFRLSADGAADTRAPRTTTYTSAVNNTWNYVVATSDGTTMRIYLNGTLQTVTNTATTPVSIFSGTGSAAIGLMDDDTTTYSATCCRQYFNGIIDEIQFSRSTARSADWIKLSYETQKPLSTCVLPQTPSVPRITTQPVGASVLAGASYTFTVVATVTYNVGSGHPLRYTWYRNSVAAGNEIVGQTASTLSLTNVQVTDTGNYYVVVSNEYGSVTSSAARLTLSGNAPTIVTQPSGVTVYQTEAATFTVVATGVGTLQYQWYKVVNGQNVAITSAATGLTAASMTITATQFSDSGMYRCVVTNAYGSVTSNSAKLTVQNGAPTITVHPRDTTVLATTMAQFRVVATGVGTLQYQWYKGTVSTGTRLTGKTASVLTLDTVRFSDSGSYVCVVTNTYGSATSNPGRLTVSDGRPVITVQPSATVSVLENRPFTLSVTATSTVGMQYTWYKGMVVSSNVVGTTNPYSISSAQLDDAGEYVCVVANVFGSCTSAVATVTVSPNREVSNPIMLSGVLVDSTRVRLSVLRYGSLLTVTPDQVFTWSPDTVLIWYGTSVPTVVNPATVRVKISKARLAAQGGNRFDTLVTVPRIGCNSYYFKGSVKWRSTAVPAARDSIPPFGNEASGAVVYMCDTAKLVNPLHLSFRYTPPADSVVVVMTGLSTPGIRWDIITQLVLRYSIGGAAFIEVPIDPATLPAGDRYEHTVTNPRFGGDSALVNWQLLFRGMYNNRSDTVKATSTVGAKRPSNTLTLVASEVQATQVTLTWTNAGSPYDSFRIWYGTTPVPDSQIPASLYSQTTVDGTQRSTQIRNLKELTAYYFGIQGQRLGVWSYIPAPAKTSATTEKDTSQAIPNTLRLLGVSYDTVTARLRMTFRIANLGFQHRYGFTWLQRDSLPTPLPEEFVVEPSSSPRVGEIQYTDKLGQILTYDFDLTTASPPLEYGKSYYFAGWVSRVGAKWSRPTDSSVYYYAIPQPRVVPVRLFSPGVEAVTAFGGQVVLRKVDAIETTADLGRRDDLPFEGSGLVPVSIGFSVSTKSSTQVRLLVGLQYNAGLLPAGATVGDIRMYHYDASRSVWLVDTSAIIADSTGPVLYVQKYLPDCRYPFVLGVDEVPPEITVSGDTSSALSYGDSIVMTVRVDDNIANPRLSLHAGRADERITVNDTVKDPEYVSGMSRDLKVSRDHIQGDCGIRVYVRADDGRHTAVVDASRDVRFTKADDVRPHYEQWTPLSATGVLDAPGVQQALDEYAGGEGGTWKYDIHQLRLFRYLTGGWLEYSEAKQDTFRFDPGRVIWLKTRQEKAIDFGSARSVSLKRPYAFTLPGKSWTDFTLPYRFNIRLGDIAAANEASVMGSLQFYKWVKPSAQGRYSARELYLPGNPGAGSLLDTLVYRLSNNDKVAYTVWNDQAKEVTLYIPGISVANSGVAGLSKGVEHGEEGWSVAIRSRDVEGELSPVFCAYVSGGGGGVVTYPQPPSWSKVNVGIYDRSTSAVYGNVITRRIENGGYTYELVFENGNADVARVTYTVERLAGDRSVEIAVIDPSSGAIVSGESALSVEIGGKSREYRLLAIGTRGYIDGYGWRVDRGVFSLGRVAPNPFRSRVTIEYTVPYGGVERVRCEIVDHRGRVLWSLRPAGHVHPGKNSITWTPDGRTSLAAGAYFVRLTGYDGTGKKTQEHLAKIMLLR